METKKKWIFIAYAALVLLIPMYIIGSSETVLRSGKLYKFRMEGYDPFDFFRGNYLRLSVNTNGIPTEKTDWEGGDKVYLKIDVDNDGYAYFSEAMDHPPKSGDYMVSKVPNWYISDERFSRMFGGREGRATISVMMPNNLGKYFINEDYAERGERLLGRQEATLHVRVLGGSSRLEDVYIRDTPIMKILEED